MTQKNIKSSVNQQFSQVAANYSTSIVHAQGKDIQTMVASAGMSGEEIVLDAGCGAGHTALAFAEHAAQVIAVDLSEAMLTQCRLLANGRAITNVEFRIGDVEELPFEDDEFALVVSRYSAHHWPNPARAVAEFRRVLRPGGHFILSDVVSFEEFVIDSYMQTIEVLRDPSHVRDHTVRQWTKMMESEGFQVEVVSEHGVWINFDSWVERMATPSTHVVALKSVFDGAPEEVRHELAVEQDYSFTFRGAVLRGSLK
ncbi:MAG: class I SAM-dependent methyltransferase [Chloroflexota bacterium]